MRNRIFSGRGLLLSPSPRPRIVEQAKFVSFLQQRRQSSAFCNLPAAVSPRSDPLPAADCAEAFPALQSHRPEGVAPPDLPPSLLL